MLNIFKMFFCQMWNSHMLSYSDINVVFCFAVINSSVAVTEIALCLTFLSCFFVKCEILICSAALT